MVFGRKKRSLPPLNPSDHDALARFEDAMVRAMGARGAHLVAVITQPTFREFLLHAPSIDGASEARSRLRQDFPSYSVQLHAEEDVDWSAYTELTGA